MRYAKVVNSIVVNLVESELPLAAPWVQSGAAEIGFIYDQEAGTFIAPFVVRSRNIPTAAFWMRMPIGKRIQIRKSQDEYVVEWLRLFDSPHLYEIDLDGAEVIEALNYFSSIGLLSPVEVAALRA
jgi:hypothetical protein